MKSRRLCLSFLFVAALLASDQRKTSGLEGFVKLYAIKPVPGAAIGVDSLTRGTHLRGTTNASGYYSFDDVRPGTYSVSAEAKGYGCIIYPHVVVQYGERLRQDFNFMTAKALSDCGTVEKKNSK